MVIKIENLKMKFPGAGSPEILNINRFELAASSQIAIFGKSGSGKTTFFNVISGVLSPASGLVSILGTDITKLKEHELDNFRSKNIGYIFQNLNLLQGYNAFENIEISLLVAKTKYCKKEIYENLESIGMAQHAKKRPHELSLGQQQRIAIIRAVMKKPALILADEPTSSLDPHNSALIIELLKKEARLMNSALIIVSHESDIISMFERQVKFCDINKASYESEEQSE